MIVQGMMQHWQSSPHQQGSLTGGFAIGPLAIDGAEEPEEVAEVVEGGIVSSRRLVYVPVGVAQLVDSVWRCWMSSILARRVMG